MIWLFPLLLLYQLYIPNDQLPAVPMEYVYLALYFIVLYCSFRVFKWFGSQKIFVLYLLFLVVLLIGAIYSPDKARAIHIVYYQTAGVFSLLLGFYCVEKKVSIERVFKLIVVIGIPIAVLNVIFFTLPELETQYLHSKVAQILVEPANITGVYDVRRNNIIDPFKSGTVFTNTNRAAVFYQMMFWISFALFMKKSKKKYLLVSILYLLANFTCYSRAGMLSFVICLLITLTISMKKSSSVKKLMWLFTPIVTMVLILLSNGFFAQISERFKLSTIEDDPRGYIWKFIWKVFRENVVLGQGVGGWELVYSNYAISVGLQPGLPPHNLFVHLWSWSGLLGLAVFVLMVSHVLKGSLKKYLSGDMLQLALFCSMLTIVVQGMFDNWFLNDYRILTLLFFMVGALMYRTIKRNKQDESEILN